MTKLKVHENKQQEQQNKNDEMNRLLVVTDSLGRVIKLQSPTLLDEYDLNIALGSNSTNLGAAGMAIMTLYVESIDGIPVVKPTTAAQIRAALKTIGKEGLKAAAKGAQDFGLITNPDSDEAKENLKKLSETNP